VLGNDGGNAGADTTHVAWGKLTNDATWGNLLLSANSGAYLPRLAHVAMVAYDHRLMAFGGANQNGGQSIDAFAQFYVSEDGGISWDVPTRYLFFPEEFATLYNRASGQFAATVDENDYLWILWGGNAGVWRGRINRLGFDK
jgi:hypothetical protein